MKELTLSRRGVEMELGGLEDWLEREQMERKMGDSLLKWLGHDKPPSVRVSHKVWRKQLVDRTRQLKLGADRARQQSDMLLLDGTDIVGAVEAVAGHEPAQAEAEPGPAAEEGASDAEEWEDREVGDWIAGSGADPEDAEAETGAGAGQRLVPEQRRLHQRGVKLLVEEGRRQLLLGWRHQLSSGGR